MARLELGAQVPGWRWDLDAHELRDWVQGVEAIGYDWVGLADHVLCAYELPGRPSAAPSTAPVVQHEVLTTLAFLAGCTSRVTLQSSVLVLPQREPLLVAKQAAELDVLSGGRFRLGVGLGWLAAEFEALGTPFAQRAARLEEAVALLRVCWSQEPVNFAGRYTTVREMSMLPKPVTPGGPPILFGGSVAAAEERAARLGDGWVGSDLLSPAEAAAQVRRIQGHLQRSGRDPASFRVQWLTPLRDDPADLLGALRGYREAGATGLSLALPEALPEGGAGARLAVDAHLRQLEMVFREVWPAVRYG